MVDTGENFEGNASAIGEWEIIQKIGMRRMEIGELVQV